MSEDTHGYMPLRSLLALDTLRCILYHEECVSLFSLRRKQEGHRLVRTWYSTVAPTRVDDFRGVGEIILLDSSIPLSDFHRRRHLRIVHILVSFGVSWARSSIMKQSFGPGVCVSDDQLGDPSRPCAQMATAVPLRTQRAEWGVRHVSPRGRRPSPSTIFITPDWYHLTIPAVYKSEGRAPSSNHSQENSGIGARTL